MPAAQLDVPHVEHGAKPVEDHVPEVQGGSATQASNVAFQAKPRLQAHLDWPEIVLLVLYSGVVSHGRQAVSPASANWFGRQAVQMMLDVALQTEAPSHTVPAAQAAVPVQAAQGARPVDDQVEPATHGKLHVLDAVFHAYPAVELQPHVVWPVALSET